VHVVLAAHDEDTPASVTVGIRVFQNVEHVAALDVPASVPKLDPRTVKRLPPPTNEPMKNGPEIVKFQARSVISGDLRKPQPSAARPPHRRR
jgi:hypothetical protein